MTHNSSPVIVHVLTRLLRAGSEENTLFSCRAQAAAGARVVLVHGQEFDPAVAERARGVCEVVRLDSLVHPIAPAADVRATRDLVGLLRARRADVVHTHQSKAGILGRVAGRIAGVPAIVHGVHILPFVNVGPAQAAVYLAAERLCAAFTGAFINVSPSVRDVCVDHGIGARRDHFVAYSAMEIDRFRGAEPPQDWRRLLGVEPGAPKPPTALMMAAFLGGRAWQRSAAPAVATIANPANLANAEHSQNQILLTSVADHLDRSERVLTDIMNAPRGDISKEQKWADDLLDASRLYRQGAIDAGEGSVASVLDDLERNLMEIVHSPSRISAADLEQIRRRIDAASLLFKVRVMSHELRQREDAPERSTPRSSTSTRVSS